MAEASNVFIGTGRRKTSVARARITNGSGEWNVNGRSIEEYFPTESLRNIATESLNTLQSLGKFDVRINVQGGGMTGQAGAVRHAVARALLRVNPENRKPLKEAGMLTRDPRMKERKKYGQPGARKRFQFSKR